MFNASHIRSQFPIFGTYPELLFADNASTTHKPRSVIDAISAYYEESNANIHRAVYDLGIQSDEIYARTKFKLTSFYNKDHCIFTSGTTDGFNKLAYGLEHLLDSKKNIIVSEMEHHSNLVPWQELCRRTGAELRICRINNHGEINLNHLAEIVDDHTEIVSLVHISNTLGTINDLRKVTEILSTYDCLFLVDAAQSCALYQESLRELEADALVFGAHKMFGPSGIGVILASEKLISKLSPFQFGGGMVTEVEQHHSEYRRDLSRYEAGTPPLAQIAGLEATLTYLEGLDLGQCYQHVTDLGLRLRSELAKEDVMILGEPDKQSGIVSVNFPEIHPHDVATFLNAKNIAIRAGHHCTQLIMKKYDMHASVRFSFSIYNESSEVDIIMDAIREMTEYFL